MRCKVGDVCIVVGWTKSHANLGRVVTITRRAIHPTCEWFAVGRVRVDGKEAPGAAFYDLSLLPLRDTPDDESQETPADVIRELTEQT